MTHQSLVMGTVNIPRQSRQSRRISQFY